MISTYKQPKPRLRRSRSSLCSVQSGMLRPTSSASSSRLRVPDGGLVLPPDTNTNAHSDLIIALAARHRLPAVYSDRLFVAAGGLMCYSTDRADQYWRAACYVDAILRGA